jgi:hypothetical protein
MRRLIIALILLLSTVASGLALTPLLGIIPHGHTFYVSPNGSNRNNGLSPSRAWFSIEKVNKFKFARNDRVLFEGGRTFRGAIVLSNFSVPGPITIGSYGTGKATISSGDLAACITATDIPSVMINSVVCAGGGNTTNSTSGISIVNDQSNNTMLGGPTIANVTVSGYGVNGIEVKGTKGDSGFSGIMIIGNTVHDNTGNYTATSSACIYLFDFSSLQAPLKNVNVSRNTVYNCTGTAKSSTWSGSGIAVDNVNGAMVQYNIVHDSGSKSGTCGGPVGIIAYGGNDVTIQFNEVYNIGTDTKTGGCDGDGIDVDGNQSGSIIQYNYTHDNVGDGLLVAAFTNSTNIGSTVRFNISHNDGSNTDGGVGGLQIFAGPDASVSGCNIYNNTVYSSVGWIFSSIDNGSVISCQVSNNIFYSLRDGGYLVYAPNSSELAMTGNDYFAAMGQRIRWNGTTYPSFATWQAATGQEKIRNANVGHTSEPQLPNYGRRATTRGYIPADLSASKLQIGSAMIDEGLNLNSEYGLNIGSRDFYGAAISSSSPPIGAGQLVAWKSPSLSRPRRCRQFGHCCEGRASPCPAICSIKKRGRRFVSR